MARRILLLTTLFFSSFACLWPVAGVAATLGLDVVVQVDTGSGFVTRGTAVGSTGTPTPLDVGVDVGDTVRFRAQLRGTPDDANIASYRTDFLVDDPNEIDYSPNTGVDLTGLGFLSGSSPDDTLTDGTPASGTVVSNTGSQPYGTNAPLFKVDYVVQSGLNGDGNVDLNMAFSSLTSVGGSDSNALETAQVRLNFSGTGIPALSPEGLALFVLLAPAAYLVRRVWARRRHV